MSSSISPPAAGRRLLTLLVALALSLGALATVAVRPASALSDWVSGIASTPSRNGYWLVGRDGAVYAFGDAPFAGGMHGTALPGPVVGIAPTPTGGGYWLATSVGGVYSFGDAAFKGAINVPLNKPIVAITPTPTGGGYWLAASDGGVFAFGDALFYGSTVGMTLNKPIVGMAATPSGRGYWLVGADGGIFAYGDAQFHGGTGGMVLNKPIVGMTRTSTGGGYWLTASDGGVFAFGNAQFYGSTASIALAYPAVGIAPGPNDAGYLLTAQDGGVFAFGSAQFRGSMADGNPPAGNQPSTETTLRNKIVQNAQAEVGKREVNGKTCYTTNGSCNSLAWCAQFASMMWLNAGVTDFHWTATRYNYMTQAQGAGRWRARTDVPKVGDVAVYYKDYSPYNAESNPGPEDISHVHIVVAVRSDGWIQTIGGNESNAVVWTNYRNPLTINSGSLRGFASPVALSGAVHTVSAASQGTSAADEGFANGSEISVANTTVNEAAGSATFTITLDASRSEPTTVSYSTAGSTAAAGSDFTSKSGSVTFAANEDTKTVTVPIANDVLYEGNETFALVLSNAVGGTIVRPTATATIVDDDPMPVVSAGDAAVEEGDSATRTVSFPVTLSEPSGKSTTVSWATSYGTASSADVTAASGTVTIPAGTTSKVVTATVTGDTALESNETFSVTLSSPVNATLGRSVANGTVIDDDLKPVLRVSVGDAAVVEGTRGSRSLVFTVSLSGTSPVAVSAAYATAVGSASSTDFTSVSGQATIAAGTTTTTVTVPIAGDMVIEADETFTITLSNAVGAAVNRAVGVGTIRNDD